MTSSSGEFFAGAGSEASAAKGLAGVTLALLRLGVSSALAEAVSKAAGGCRSVKPGRWLEGLANGLGAGVRCEGGAEGPKGLAPFAGPNGLAGGFAVTVA